MQGIASTLATIWRLASPYFRSEDRRAGIALLVALIGTELSLVAINVLLNQWNNRFYNALQDRNWDAFVSELQFFSILLTETHRLAHCDGTCMAITQARRRHVDRFELSRQWHVGVKLQGPEAPA